MGRWRTISPAVVIGLVTAIREPGSGRVLTCCRGSTVIPEDPASYRAHSGRIPGRSRCTTTLKNSDRKPTTTNLDPRKGRRVFLLDGSIVSPMNYGLKDTISKIASVTRCRFEFTASDHLPMIPTRVFQGRISRSKTELCDRSRTQICLMALSSIGHGILLFSWLTFRGPWIGAAGIPGDSLQYGRFTRADLTRVRVASELGRWSSGSG